MSRKKQRTAKSRANPRRPRSIEQIARLYRSSPNKLTKAELIHLRRELKRRKRMQASAPSDASYEHIKQRAASRNAELSRQGRDIAPVPPIADEARRARCERDFGLFLATYFGHVCYRPPCADVVQIIQLMQGIVLSGGLQAEAEPRGFGKTTRARLLCLWAILYGHRRFVVLVGKNATSAAQNLRAIKTAFETNQLLGEDFPEAVYPIRRLEGIANRCSGQHVGGQRTHVVWKNRQIVLPTIAGSRSSGAVFWCLGINSSEIRGLTHEHPSDGPMRPDLVVIDDVQDRKSAQNPLQVDKLEEAILGDVLGMAGRGKKIAALMPCTVISPGDLADRMLDRQRRPDWNGRRLPLLKSFPQDMRLWDEYRAIRAESQRAGQANSWATKFYHEHRAEMDEGAAPTWPELHDEDEISSVQHAMNRLFRDEAAFWAEDQNQPKVRESESEQLDADKICERVNRLGRGVVPLAATHLTAFIDVQGALLYYLVLGVADDFTGGIVEYGTFPEQQRAYFSLRDASPTLQRTFPGAHQEGAIFAGLTALTKQLLGREWEREGGGGARIARCLIDANWGISTDLVYQFCRQSEHAALLVPSHGRFFGAASTPLSEWQPKQGERVGLNWRLGRAPKRATAHVMWDGNFWKSFTAARLTTAIGDRGAWSLFGDRAEAHRLLSEHLTAEKREPVSARGRTIDEWKQRPGRDNHWWDCLVGAAVAASIAGAALLGQPSPASKPRVKWSEVQRARRQGR